MTPPWGLLAMEPRYVLTADQDWAPEWCNTELMAYVAELRLPMHVFRTSPSPALDRAFADGVITQGWHPNFAPGSSHGDDPRSVIEYCRSLSPGATTVRSHAFSESSQAWWTLAAAGVRFDSQYPSAHMGHLLPSVHSSGIRRLPVYLEDDVWFEACPGEFGLDPVARTFRTPGLKILNFHPVQFGLNTPSWEYYDSRREEIFAPGSDGSGLVHEGVGVRTLMANLIGAVDRFVPFNDLCKEVDAILAGSEDLLGPVVPLAALRGQKQLVAS